MPTTLISGFEDIIAHIKQQEQRIMNLEEENKKLKEKIKEYEIESNESGVQEQKLYRQLFQFEAENDKLQEENKELKEENKKLKEQLEDDTRQVHQLFAENYKLQEELILSAGGD